MKNENILTVENLTRSRGKKFRLNEISFTVGKNEILAILGPNGAGKTTTLELITLLEKPEGGKISFYFDDTHRDVIRNIGYSPENTAVWPELTVEEQCLMIMRMYGLRFDSREYLKNLFSVFNLYEYRDTIAVNLSQGNIKKLSIILAVLHRPSLMILDEPFNGLDFSSRRSLKEWIRSFARQENHAVLISSHQLEEIQQTADRALIMVNGSILHTVKLEKTNLSGFSLAEHYDGVLEDHRDG